MSLDRTFCTRFTNGECANDKCPSAMPETALDEVLRNAVYVRWADRRTEDCGYVPPKENEA